MDTRRIVRSAGIAAVAWAVVSAFAAEPSFGTFTDARDGQTYKTVKIGGRTWSAENLNFQTDSGSSWCYKNSVDSCKKYGRLYYWYAATTVCPDGWKLPDTADWNRLEKAVGGSEAGKRLKAKSGWNNDGGGTDDYGFSASPGGYRTSGGDFGGVGDRGRWWTATEGSGGGRAYHRDMDYYHGRVDGYGRSKANGFSVRCIADAP